METLPATRKPLGIVSDSVLNSPQRVARKGASKQKTPIKSDRKPTNFTTHTPIEVFQDDAVKIRPPELSVVNTKPANGKPVIEVTFPPGNMGLDLEPLISSVSPERLIGCRVKDFYFGIDHSGISEEQLRATLSPGHIIASINGEEVLFAQFMDILEKLRSLKPHQRKVCFKTLSTEESAGIHGLRSPTGSSMIFSPDRDPRPSSKHRSPSKSRRIDPSMLSTSGSVHEEDLPRPRAVIVTQSAPMLASGGAPVFPTNLMVSPRAVKRISQINDDQSVAPDDSQLATPPQSPQKVIQSFISASKDDDSRAEAKRKLGICSTQPTGNDADGSSDNEDGISVGSLHSCLDDDVSSDMHSVAEVVTSAAKSDLTHKLVHVGAAFGSSVVSAAAVVGHSAEHIMGSSLPRYSASQMEDVVTKKHNLLQELSKTCMLLGISEQRQSTLESQLQRLRQAEERADESRRQAEDRYRHACARFEGTSMELASVQADRDAWSARAHAAETEIAALRGDIKNGEEKIKFLQSEVEIGKSQSNSYRDSIDHLEQAVIDAKQGTRLVQHTLAGVRNDLKSECEAHEKDLQSWQAQFDRMEEEQEQLKAELEMTLLEASERFASLEGEKEVIQKEVDDLRKAVESSSVAHKEEIQNLRDSMMAQQEWQRERLQEKDAELTSLRATVAEISHKDLEMTAQMAADQFEIEELREAKKAALNEVNTATQSIQSLESKMKAISDEKYRILKDNGVSQADLANKTEELAALSAKFDVIVKEKTDISEELHKTKKNQKRMEDKCNTLAKQINVAREEATASSDSWKQVVALMKVQLEEKEEEKNLALFKANLDTKISREAADSERNDLVSRVSELEVTEKSLRDELECLSTTFAALNEAASSAQERFQVELSEVGSNLSSQQKANADLEASLLGRNSDIEALRGKVAIAEEQVTDIQMLLNRSNDKIAALEKDVERNSLLFSELEKKYHDVVVELENLENEKRDLIQLNEESERNRVGLCERFEDEQLSNISKLRSEIEQGLVDVSDLQDSLQEERARSTLLQAQAQEKDLIIEDLEEQCQSIASDYESKFCAAERERGILDNNILELKNDISECNKINSYQEATMLSLRESLRAERTKLESSTAFCSDLQERLAELEQALKEKEATEILYKESCGKLELEEAKASQLQLSVDELRRRCEDTDAALSSTTEAKAQVQQALQALEKQHSTVLEEVAALRATEKTLGEAAKESAARIDNLATDLQTEVDSHNLLKSVLNNDQRVHSTTLQELEATKLSNHVLTEETATLREMLSSKESTLTHKEEVIVGRGNEITNLQEKVQKLEAEIIERNYAFSDQDNAIRRNLHELFLILGNVHEKLLQADAAVIVQAVIADDVCLEAESCLGDGQQIESLLPLCATRMKDFYLCICQLMDALGEKDVELGTMSSQVQAISAELSALQLELADLRGECEIKTDRISRLSESIDMLTRNHNEMLDDLKSSEKRIDNFQEREKLLKTHFIDSLIEIKGEFQSIQKDTKDLIQSASLDVSYMVKSGSKNFMEHIYNAQMNEREARYELESYKEDALCKNSDVVTKLREYDGAVDALEIEVAELNKRRRDTDSQLSELRSERDSLLADRFRLQELRTEYGIAMDTMKLLTEDSRQAKAELESHRSREKILKSEHESALRTAMTNLSNVEKKLSESDKDRSLLMGQVVELKNEVRLVKLSSADSTEAVSSALESKISDLTAERDDMINRIEEMQFMSRHREEARREEMAHVLEAFRVDRALILDRVQSTQDSGPADDSIVKSMDHELSKSSDEVKQIQIVLSFLRNKITEVESDKDEIVDKYQQLLLTSEACENSLKENLKTAVEGYRVDRSLLVGRYEEQISQLSSEVKDLKCQIDNMKETYDRAGQDANVVSKIQSSYQQLQGEHLRVVESLKGREQNLMQENESLSSVIESLKQNITCDRDEHVIAKHDWALEKEELTRVVSELRKELGNISSLKFTVEEELAVCSVQVSELENELNISNMRSRRAIAESAKAKKELDLTLAELKKVSEAHCTLKGAYENTELQSKDIQSKLQKAEELCALMGNRTTDSESLITSLRDSLDAACAERDVLRSELDACKQNVVAKAAEALEARDSMIATSSELEDVKSKLVMTESKLLVAVSTTDEFMSDATRNSDMQTENDSLKEKIVTLSALINEQQQALDAAAAHELESATNRGIFQKIAVESDAQAKRFGDQVVELSRLVANNQGEILHLKSQLKEKRNELKAMNQAVASMLKGETASSGSTKSKNVEKTASSDNGRMTETSPSVQQQMIWRDDLWTQALDIQSAVTDVATVIDGILPALKKLVSSTTEESVIHTSDSPSSVSSRPVRNTRMKAAAAMKKSENNPELYSPTSIPSAETLGMNIQNILDQLHDFQAVLLSPPWNDETVFAASSEIISGNIVPLKNSQCKRHAAASSNVLVMKAVIRMLLRVVRSQRKVVSESISSKTTMDSELAMEDIVNYNSELLSKTKYLESSRHTGSDLMNESNASSIWNVSDESEQENEYTLEELGLR